MIKLFQYILILGVVISLTACGGTNAHSIPPVDNASAEENITISVAPRITLNGESLIKLHVGDNYKELGSIATDDVDKNITVVIEGEVDTTIVGKYILTYTATNDAGKNAKVTRTIIVLDTIAPQITLNGESPMILYVGYRYEELGAIATDNVDKNMTVVKEGEVDTTIVGEYRITYTATDVAGNSAKVTRIITVKKSSWGHGKLKVSSNNKMLQYTDDSGFFWMADTAWNLYRQSQDNITHYLNNRAKKKFTVIMAVAMHHGNAYNGAGTERPLEDTSDIYSGFNESWWEHIDYLIDTAAEKGLYVGLLPVWHDALGQKTFKKPEDASYYAKWIAERYKDKENIIWIIGGDTQISGERMPGYGDANETEKLNLKKLEISIWNALGNAIDENDPNHLITFHPSMKIPSKELDNPEWLDFNMLQTARDVINTSITRVQEAMKAGLAVVDGESLYENLRYAGESNLFNNGRRTAYQIREDAYSEIFIGAFGNTYGHNAVYPFSDKRRTECESKTICSPEMTWQDALDAPGAVQMQYVTELMQSRPLVGRVAAQSLIEGTPNATDGIIATKGDGYVMIYTPQGKDITVNMPKIAEGNTIQAWWYNPRDGNSTNIGIFENSDTHIFSPPGEATNENEDYYDVLKNGKYKYHNGNDWILVLDDTSKGFIAPGK